MGLVETRMPFDTCSKAQKCLGSPFLNHHSVCLEEVRILYCFPEEGRKETIINTYCVLTNLPIAACSLGRYNFPYLTHLTEDLSKF